MNKRWIAGAACMLLMLICAAASADTLDILKPMWLNALEDMQAEEESSSGVIAEPKVTSSDEALEVVRSGVHMFDQYETEAYVYAELKNVGESVIRINGATLTVLDAGGRQVSRREYASAKPDVVMPGESVYISEWLYDFAGSLRKVSAIEVTLERSEYSRKRIEGLPEVKAYVEDGYLYAQLTNTTDEILYDAGMTAVVSDGGGRILDMLREETYSSLGVMPGSTVVFRKHLEQHALDIPEPVCEAEGWRYSE